MPKIVSEYHVVPDTNGGWCIKKSGSLKILHHFKTKSEAIRKAKIIGRNSNSTLVIHKKDGTIQEKTILSTNYKSSESESVKVKRTFGSAKGKVHMAKDFDTTYEY